MKKLLILMVVLAALFTTSAFAALTDNISSWYKMEDMTDYYSVSALTAFGTPRNIAALLGNGYGDYNGASAMFATNRYIRTGSQTSLLNATNSLSISVWIRQTATGNSMDILHVQQSTNRNDFLLRRDGATGLVTMCMNASSQVCVSLPSNTSQNYNLVVGTYNATSGKMKLFVGTNNGVTSNESVRQITSFGMTQANQQIWWGYDSSGNWGCQWCQVDESGVWKRALGQTDVEQLYNSKTGLRPPFPDVDAPTVSSPIPTAGTNYSSVGGSIPIGITTTDDVAISTATATITYPNATTYALALPQYSTTSNYNSTFTIPNLQGRFNISYRVNDTSNNNATTTSWFYVDSQAPTQVMDAPNSEQYNTKPVTVAIRVNVTDATGIAQVNCTVVDPDHTGNSVDADDLITMSLSSGSTYAGSYTSDNLNGQYNVTCDAKDVFGNVGTSSMAYFTIDTALPLFSDTKPISATIFTTASQTLDLATNVTLSAGSLAEVYANVTTPSSAKTKYTLTNSVGNKYNTSYSLGTEQGTYTVLYYAIKTNNITNTLTGNYFVLDSVPPSVTTNTPTSLAMYGTIGSTVPLIVNVTDANFAISSVIASIVYPDSSKHNFSMVASGSSYGYNFTTIDMDGYYNVTFVASDVNGVTNSSTAQFYIDAHIPTLSTPVPSTNTVFNASGTIQIGITAIDSMGIVNAWAVVTAPDANTQTIQLSHQSGNVWNSSYGMTHTFGRYNISYYANDSVNHVSDALVSYFYLDDRYPQFANLTSNTEQLLWSGTATFSADIAPTNNTVFLNFNGTNYVPTKSGNHYNYSRFVSYANYTYYWVAYGDGILHRQTSSTPSVYVVNFTPDVTAPNVSLIAPGYGQNYSIQSEVLLSLDVVDDRQVGAVWAIVTTPTGNTSQVFLSNTQGSTYSGFYSLPATGTGNYLVNFTAQDATGNNNTGVSSLFVYVAPKTGLFNVNSCPDTATGTQIALYLGILFFIGAAIWMSFAIKQPIIGVLACIGLIFFGFVFVGCSVALGLIIIGLGVLLMVVSIFQ